MLEPVIPFYKEFWGVGPFIFWGRRLCAPNVTTNWWCRFTPVISTPIISVHKRALLDHKSLQKYMKSKKPIPVWQILTKRTQQKSEWMIANNMVQIWAPTYFHMLFVRSFFSLCWNLGQPLYKHFTGGWPHHFVSTEVGCAWIVLTKWWPKWTPLIYRGISTGERVITSISWIWWAKSADEWILESRGSSESEPWLRRSSNTEVIASSDFNGEVLVKGWDTPTRWLLGMK